MNNKILKVASIIATGSLLVAPLKAKADSDYYSTSHTVGDAYVTAYIGYDGTIAYEGYNATDYVDAVINGWVYEGGNHLYGSFSERSSAQASLNCHHDILEVFGYIDVTSSDGSEYHFQLSTAW